MKSALETPFKLDSQNSVRTSIIHCCSASIGIEMYHDDSVCQEELLKHADVAMYEAKKHGNSIIFMKI